MKCKRKIIGILCIIIFSIIVSLIFIYKDVKQEKNSENTDSQFIQKYTYLSKEMSNETYKAYLDTKDKNIINNEVKLYVEIEKYNNTTNYNILYSVNDKRSEINGKERNEIQICFEKEGKQIIKVQIYKNNELQYEGECEVYYIKPYKKQFLEEMSTKGVNAHFIDGTWENYNKSLELMKYAGIKYIRAGIKWESIEKTPNNYDFTRHDGWINKANEYKINLILNFTGIGNLIGKDKKINSSDELTKFENFARETVKRYNFVKKYEMFNEPNLDYNEWLYATETYLPWYCKSLQTLHEVMNKENNKADIIAGSTAIVETKNRNLSSQDFLNKIINNGSYSNMDSYAYHVYDWTTEQVKNIKFYNSLEIHKKAINKIGGFIYQDVTEYGTSSYLKDITEEVQAEKEVQYSIILDSYNIRLQTIYNFWNIGTDNTKKEHNFGLIHNNYTPKPSYYAMKNYYENTNGAEYIGKISLKNNVEAHVYNKDGKPIIIAWSTLNGKDTEILYKDFVANDIYGNEIKNKNNILTITETPVYIYNVSNNYFYQAISNVGTEKYTEFLKEYDSILSSNSSMKAIKNNIENLKNYISRNKK